MWLSYFKTFLIFFFSSKNNFALQINISSFRTIFFSNEMFTYFREIEKKLHLEQSRFRKIVSTNMYLIA